MGRRKNPTLPDLDKYLKDRGWKLVTYAEGSDMYRKFIYELNDAAANGIIREDYRYLPTVYDTLPTDLKDQLILYRNELLSRLQYRASRDQLIHCVSFAAFLKKNGIFRAQDISTKLISEYHAYADTIGDTYICLYSVRFFLQFLAEHGVIAGHIPFVLTSPLHAKSAGYAISRFLDEISAFEENGVDADEYWNMANSLVGVLREKYHPNEDATRNNYLVYYQMFYIFLKEFSLPYSAANVRHWTAPVFTGYAPKPT